VRRGEVQVARIGRQREWQLVQSVEFCIHVSSVGTQASAPASCTRGACVPTA
jgi:hypothetical protein